MKTRLFGEMYNLIKRKYGRGNRKVEAIGMKETSALIENERVRGRRKIVGPGHCRWGGQGEGREMGHLERARLMEGQI